MAAHVAQIKFWYCKPITYTTTLFFLFSVKKHTLLKQGRKQLRKCIFNP